MTPCEIPKPPRASPTKMPQLPNRPKTTSSSRVPRAMLLFAKSKTTPRSRCKRTIHRPSKMVIRDKNKDEMSKIGHNSNLEMLSNNLVSPYSTLRTLACTKALNRLSQLKTLRKSSKWNTRSQVRKVSNLLVNTPWETASTKWRNLVKKLARSNKYSQENPDSRK